MLDAGVIGSAETWGLVPRPRRHPPGQRPVAGHAAVDARGHLRRVDAVILREDLRRLAEGMARLEHTDIGLDEGRVLGEALLDGVERRIEWPRVDPGDEPEGEEVLAALLLLGVERQVFERLLRHRADVDLVEAVLLGQPRVGERVLGQAVAVLGVAGLFQFADRMRPYSDENAARLKSAKHLEAPGHHDERVELIARRVDLAAELELEVDTEKVSAGARISAVKFGRRDVVAAQAASW